MAQANALIRTLRIWAQGQIAASFQVATRVLPMFSLS